MASAQPLPLPSFALFSELYSGDRETIWTLAIANELREPALCFYTSKCWNNTGSTKYADGPWTFDTTLVTGPPMRTTISRVCFESRAIEKEYVYARRDRLIYDRDNKLFRVPYRPSIDILYVNPTSEYTPAILCKIKEIDVQMRSTRNNEIRFSKRPAKIAIQARTADEHFVLIERILKGCTRSTTLLVLDTTQGITNRLAPGNDGGKRITVPLDKGLQYSPWTCILDDVEFSMTPETSEERVNCTLELQNLHEILSNLTDNRGRGALSFVELDFSYFPLWIGFFLRHLYFKKDETTA